MKTHLLSVLLLLSAFAARAADVVNNLGNAPNDALYSDVGSIAQAFDTGPVATRLSSVTVRLFNNLGTTNATVRIWTGSSTSNVPSSPLEPLGSTGDFTNPSAANYTFSSATGLVLPANTRIWVVVAPGGSNNGVYGWSKTSSAAFTTDAGASLPSVRAENDGSGWVPIPTGDVQMMTVSSKTIVANTNDSGAGSLRQALADAAALSGPDTITFSPALSGQTIALNGGSDLMFGGSAFVLNDDVTIDASALPGGITLTASAGGYRCFFVFSGSLTLRGLTVSGFAGQGGFSGGVMRNSGTLSLIGCTLSGNPAGNANGAISNSGGGTLTLTQCTLSGNSASGGVISNGGTLSLTHCTLSGNSTSPGNGTINSATQLNLENSIVAGTLGGSTVDIVNLGTLTRIGASIVPLLNQSGTLSGSGTISTAAPMLAPLGSYGGPTQTMPPLAGSPAIDGVTAGSEVPGLTTDQRGVPRSADAEGNGSVLADIGAVELQVRLVTTAADESDGIGVGAGTSLREALADNSGGSDIIRFDPAVFTGATPATNTISPGNPDDGYAITVSNRVVSVDARDITTGVTLDGALQGFGLIHASVGSNVAFSGLTFTRGGAPTFGYGGGALKVDNNGTVLLTGCTFSDNVSFVGGAIYNSATTTLSHCTVANNFSAGDGGGIYQRNGTLALTRCTVTGNSTSGGGGGIIAYQGTLTFAESIIAGNDASTGPDIWRVAGAVNPTGINFVGDTAGSSLTAGGTILTGDAKLDPAGLGAHGGPTKTIALLAGSPALEASVDATADQRGFPVFIAPDLGAYERQLGTIADQSFNEDTVAGPIGFNVGHVGTFSGASSNTTLVPNANISAGFDGANTVVNVTPAQDANGSATITLTDNLSGETLSFGITFAPVNDPPRFTKGGFQLAFVDSGAHTVPGWATGISAGPPDETGTLTFHATNDNNALFSAQPAVAADGTLTFTPAAGARGVAIVSVTLSDDGSNVSPNKNTSSSKSFVIAVRLTAPLSTVQLAQGDAAPGRMSSADLPDDAVIASFNTPAIDEAGNIAFLAKWTSVTGPVKKGAGLFLNDQCLAVGGGDASAIGGAGVTWKSFSDPVVSAGHVACIAKLSTGASAVVCNRTGATLEKIALTGEAATLSNLGPSATDPKYKSFKSVSVVGDNVAYLAQLTVGTGTPKVSAADDVGIWFQGAKNFVALRENQTDSGRTIKTLVSFLPGNGSPGCGRGWFIAPSDGGDPQVAALVKFTDGTQGAVFQDMDAVPSFSVISRSGDAATGVDNGATFASYGLPARDAAETTAFLGKLTIANGVTKADASGIFTGPDMDGKFATVIRTGGNATQAGGTGAKFSALKDPVLNEFAGVAFPATVKGGTAKGAAMQTLWWQIPGQPLELVAQGGTDAAELPGSKWKAFTSLAIAERGPVFAATLTPNASGVWAKDFAGDTRLLFRTGAPAIAGGKTVKKFTLLNATVGSPGVTRSVSDFGKVVWLATFTDKSQAIVTTEVP